MCIFLDSGPTSGGSGSPISDIGKEDRNVWYCIMRQFEPTLHQKSSAFSGLLGTRVVLCVLYFLYRICLSCVLTLCYSVLYRVTCDQSLVEGVFSVGCQ